MHALHRILLLDEDKTPLELISEAEGVLDNYPQTHDYYSSIDESSYFVGRDIPYGVIYDSKMILEQVETVEQEQIKEIHRHMRELERIYGENFTVKEAVTDMIFREDTLPAWRLSQMAQLASGDYTFDSMFYDDTYGTAKVRPELKEDLKLNPNKYAMVLMDLHI